MNYLYHLSENSINTTLAGSLDVGYNLLCQREIVTRKTSREETLTKLL